jgi:hypothetical protein
MILVTTTYEIVTPESAEHGEADTVGVIAEHEPMTFRELVKALRYGESSCYRARGETFEWVTQDQGETHAYFERGEQESRSYHFSRNNPPRKARYWRLAFKAAGLIKE